MKNSKLKSDAVTLQSKVVYLPSQCFLSEHLLQEPYTVCVLIFIPNNLLGNVDPFFRPIGLPKII